MDIASIITSAVAVITAYGGAEGLKVWLRRKTDARKADTEADVSEFHALKEYNDFLQQQIIDKEKRFIEQTDLVRKQNNTILQDTKERADLDLELQKYRCQISNCPHRQPPNGY